MSKEKSPNGSRLKKRPTEIDEGSGSIFSMRNVVFAALITALAGGVIDTGKRQEVKSTQASADHKKAYKENLEKTDELIGKIESGYLDFGEALKPKLASINNKYLRDLITKTFGLVETNVGNTDKNYVRFLHHFPQAGKDIAYLDKDFIPFFYYVMSPEYMIKQNSNARFTGPLRILQVKSDLDPGNLINMVTLMHELVHAEQDNEIRRNKLTKKEYYDQERVLTIDTLPRESYARACEVEAANAYLDGMLERLFKHRSLSELPREVGTLANEIMPKLNAREDQKKEIIGLIKLSIVYYINGGAQEERLHPMFVQYVHEFY